MNESVLGIDLGTSSVKILQKFRDGDFLKYKAEYESKDSKGWWEAICSLLEEIDFETVKGIGLTSQVGTYIVNEREVYSWESEVGKEELEEILREYEESVFRKEICMNHPALHSYPIPRLLYFKKKYDRLYSVCQPKDIIYEKLTGEKVTDPYSWRGLANTHKQEYSAYFIKQIGIESKILPRMAGILEKAGETKDLRGKGRRLPSGIPVFCGLNDFYASLVGMGLNKEGVLFDITGTSEHLGRLTEEKRAGKGSITSPYLIKNVNYGVTSSSGAAIRKALKIRGEKFDLLKEEFGNKEFLKKAPVCLPYLKGERAPVYDPDARGTFFGVGETTSEREIFYSLMEGVVFGLYHIYESMGNGGEDTILAAGGAADIEILNLLKAEIFEMKIEVMEETDTSALGAAMIAAVGAGWYQSLEEAQKEMCRKKAVYLPKGGAGEILQKRYGIYKDLYPVVKPLFKNFKELGV